MKQIVFQERSEHFYEEYEDDIECEEIYFKGGIFLIEHLSYI
jgi:hypothetical protein